MVGLYYVWPSAIVEAIGAVVVLLSVAASTLSASCLCLSTWIIRRTESPDPHWKKRAWQVVCVLVANVLLFWLCGMAVMTIADRLTMIRS
jgi:hypothetical protein